jgi:Lon-like ATP-dependent protease
MCIYWRVESYNEVIFTATHGHFVFTQLSQDPLRVRVEHLRDEPYSNDDILKATSMEVVNTMRDLLHLNPLYGEQFRTLLSLSECL